jgi:HEPN domain-containing protein
MNAPETNCKAWLVKADNDLLNIENNLAATHVPWDTVSFHAQQVAEKLLRAFLVYQARPLTRTHDLVALLAGCAEISPCLAGLEQDCQELSYYAVASRYPADLYEPQEKEAREMIDAARRLRAAILACLP